MPDKDSDEEKEKKELKKTDVELMAEKRKALEEREEEVKKGVHDYFNSIGINPDISRNRFGLKEAIETFAKAEDALKTRKENAALIRNILDKAWQIFKLMT